MNAGPISNGVSHRSGDAFRADLEATDILADLETHDYDSHGHGGGAVGYSLYVDASSSRIYPKLAGVTETILTKSH